MGLKEFKDALQVEHDSLASSGFEHIITNTKFVPDLNDEAITYPDLVNKTQKSKRLESAVLFVDMRGSTAMSLGNQDMTQLAPVYAAFIRSMSKCAHYYGGKVRNINGDRVMVVFDRERCFTNAVNTAILMNSVVQYMLKDRFQGFEIRAGIGIDFGQMLVSKSGVIKQGDENDPNKALVWLGKPANVASKLTDLANKVTEPPRPVIKELHRFGLGLDAEDYWWEDRSVEEFLGRLAEGENNELVHSKPSFVTYATSATSTFLNPPILMTKDFYDIYAKQSPEAGDVLNGWWNKQKLAIPGYGNDIVGGSVFFTAFQES